MQTLKSSIKESYVSCFSNRQKHRYQQLLQLLFAVLLLSIGIQLNAQTSTCTGATSLTVVNGASCSASTTFNISTNTASVAYSTCATGVVNPCNGWGQFVANGSTASIVYTPVSGRDAMIFAYGGICGVLLTQIGCVNAAGTGGTETLNLTGLSAGSTYFVRIVRYNNTGSMNGSICVASPGTISTGFISGSPFCAGSSVSVSFTSTGAYTGNTYTAELSNASGSFASPTAIGTLISNANSGTITATIPIATAAGSGYRIRVTSNGPAITGSDNGSNITVYAAPSISGTLSVCAGLTTTLTGSGTPALINPWLSATTSVATTNSSGVVTGVAAGTSVITYRNISGCSNTATVTVNALPTISGTLSVCAGSTTTLTGSGTPAASNPWVSATTSVATVNSSGLVNGVAAGTSIITYTNNNGCIRNATVTVNALPTITGTLTVCTGLTITLSGSATAAASNPWVSATTSVATVTSSGVVTGVSAGTSVITYTNNNGCIKTATVTVNQSPGSVTITPTSATICTGSIQALTTSNYINSSPQNNSSGTISVGIPDNSATGATSTIAVSGIPADATITGVSVNFNITHTYDGDLMLNIKAPNGNVLNLVNRRGGSGDNFSNTTINSSSAALISSGSAPFSSTYAPDAASGVGPTSNVSNITSFSSLYSTPNGNWVFSARDNANSDVGTITSWSVTLTYTLPTITWQTNITSLYVDAAATTTPYVAQAVTTVYAKPSSNQSYTATATTVNGCTNSTSVAVTITAPPTITASATAGTVCFSSSSQNSTLSYSATTNSPTQYAVTWDAAALSAGLVNLSNTAITSSPLSIPIAANVAAGTYNGTVLVTNPGCTGSSSSFTITINPSPTITAASTSTSKCFSSSYQNGTITYTATTGSPTNYTITWDATALAAGLTNMSSTALAGSPVIFGIHAGTVAGTYNATIAVTNSIGCSSAQNSFTQTIVGLPTITSSATAATKCFSATSQNSTLNYSATTGSPTLYRITWDAAAQLAGLVNLGLTSLSSSTMNVPVAGGVVAGTYNGTVNVMNGFGCQSSVGNSFTLTIISGSGPVMTSASTASVCSGGTVSIALTSDIPATYTWIATDNANTTGESTTLQTTSTLSNTVTITAGVTQTVNYYVTPTAGCAGNAQTVAVTVNPLPTITTSASAASKCYNSSAQTSTLSYSATTNSPATYSITWNAAAITAGLVNTGNITLASSPITFSIPAGVAVGTYTGTLYVTTAAGCSSAGNSFTVSITSPPTISSQPASITRCTGTSASFSVTATGTSLTYQWRKGTTNLCSCGPVSGATSATLSISSVVAGDAATNYNCVISSGSCSVVISDYATLTVNASGSAPTALPKNLVFPTVSTTSVLASFTASSDATNYLVIRKTTNVAPTNPSNGTTYVLNSTTLTGTVDYVGTSTSFTSNGLTPGTRYYYWVFPYNTSTCGTSPLYLTTTPLTDSVLTATNVDCGTVATLYWGGTGSGLTGAVSGTDFNTASNWSTSSSSYVASPAAPTQCNNASLALTSNATITLSGTTDIYGLTFTISGNNLTAKLSTEGNTLTVNSDAVVDVLSGNTNTAIHVGENGSGGGIIDFKSNFKIGETYFSGSIPKSYIMGNINSKITFRGDVLFGRTARFNLPGSVSYPPSYPLATPGAGTTPGTIEFDGIGLQQVLWNNNVYYDCFYNIVVGNQNKPYVKHVTGTYTPDNVLGDFTINDGCTVDFGTSQWIREQSGGTFTMNGSAKLIMGNYQSVRSSYNTGVRVTGSNFPGGFSTMNISSSSTIEYNGGNSITQTVYATPTYGNLILSNTDGTGTANKISTAVVAATGDIIVSNKTTFTPGADITSDGTTYINSGGTLVCGTRVVSGNGTFNLLSGGTLTMASTAGITSSGATGNIQTSGRVFSTSGNYTYNASSAQAIGNGLPTTVNNLTISNSAGVTMYAASSNYTVAGTLALTTGALTINGDSLTINSLTRTSGTLTGSATSSVGVSGTSIPLFFTSGGRILKNLFLNTNASADLQTTLDITAGSSAGSVTVGSGSTLTTYGYLTLKSDANGTARVSEIPVNGSGTALGTISGNVVIERYIPGRRSWRLVTAPVQSSGSQTINEAWQEGVTNTDLSNNQNPNPGFGVHISGSSPTLGFDVTPLNNSSLKVFTRTTSTWGGIANTLSSHVRDYEGYMLFARGSRSTNLFQNTSAALSNTVIRENDGIRMGRQSVSLPGGTGTYSVVGNPYPSTIDFRTLSISGSGSTSSFVMWDPALTGIAGVGAYQYFTQSGGAGSNYTVFPGGGSYGVSGTVNNYVQSGQAFLVQNSGAATLTINESSKASPSTSAVFRPMPDNITGRISTILYGYEADSSLTVLDGGLMMYRSEYANNLDLEDVKKLSNMSSENFGITKGTTVYQIEKKQSIDETDTIYYSMRNLKARKYQLVVELNNIEATGMTAYLKDNYTGSVTTLDYSNPYTLTFTPTNAAAGSYAPDRFKIYFRQLIVLPVTFTSLDAFRKENTIHTEWKVQNELNIHHYEVEKSVDGINFTKQSNTIPADRRSVYQWADEHPQVGLNYFRVKSVGNNGSSKRTNVVKVFFGKQASGIAVYPNPVSDGQINLYFTEEQTGNYTARLFNNNGQLIKTDKLKKATGNGSVAIKLDNNLPHGNYIIEITKPDNSRQNISIVY